MTEYSVGKTTTTTLNTAVQDFSVNQETTDGAEAQAETWWDNEDFTEYYGYYKTIPELRAAITAYATWVLGRGWSANNKTTVSLNKITGMGEDTFNSIMWNLLVVKKVNGDAYAEVIRDPKSNALLNLKPLDPSTMRTVVNDKGVIKRYEQRSKTDKNAKPKNYKPNQILHLMNDRFADEIHGTSIIESVKWAIDARNEAMADKRRVHHRSTIRVIEVESENTTQINKLKTQYQEAIKNGEVLIVPKDNVSFQDAPINYLDTESWIRYLEDFIYIAIGVPKSVLGGVDSATESSAKVSYLSYEQIYTREVVELEQDLFSQLAIKVTFNKPTSLSQETQQQEAANPSQTGFQPNDTAVPQANTPI